LIVRLIVRLHFPGSKERFSLFWGAGSFTLCVGVPTLNKVSSAFTGVAEVRGSIIGSIAERAWVAIMFGDHFTCPAILRTSPHRQCYVLCLALLSGFLLDLLFHSLPCLTVVNSVPSSKKHLIKVYYVGRMLLYINCLQYTHYLQIMFRDS
jgi:hypothetical protein